MTKDKIQGAEVMEEAEAMIKTTKTIGRTTKEVEAEVLSVDCGEPMEITTPEDEVSPRQALEIHNTREYHNIDTFVVFVITEGIMTISVTPSNIYFMPCSNKMVNKPHKQTMTMTTLIKMNNRLFRRGIPHP